MPKSKYNINNNKTIKIGGIEVMSPFSAAPMAGITDAPTRLLAGEMGASLTYSEMISGKGLLYDNRKTEELLRILPGEKPVAYQIFGSDPEVIRKTVSMLAGRANVMIDINMGCPVPKVVKNGEGSALMKDPQLIYEIVKAAVEGAEQGAQNISANGMQTAAAEGAGTAGTDSRGAQPKPITVKMRAGWDEEHINAVEAAEAAEAAGAAAAAVHGRTRDQYYTGRSDRSVIADVKKALTIPVIGSGDVFTAGDAVAMMEETGCDMVMIARGALGDPWIFREANAMWRGEPVPDPPSLEEKKAMMERHLRLMTEEKGERAAVREMRKHFGWYMKGEPGATAFRRKVNTITDAGQLYEIIKNLGQ